VQSLLVVSRASLLIVAFYFFFGADAVRQGVARDGAESHRREARRALRPTSRAR
jgi:hypothetical protein